MLINKNIKRVVYVVVFILLILFVGFKYVKNKNKCNKGLKCVEAEEFVRSYNYEDIAGVFKYSADDCSFTLILSDEGMFKYSYGCGWNLTMYGNYIIKDDRLYINKVFQTGSDPSIKIFDENYIDELIITGNDFIIDNSSIVKTTANIDEVYLKKVKKESYDIREDYNHILVERVTDIINHCSD